jgi:methionyl-tRNA synthetase
VVEHPPPRAVRLPAGHLDGDDLLTGTDDNSLNNVLAAQAAGVSVREWVDRHADAIEALRVRWRCRTTTSSAPAATRGTRSGWSGCGAPAPPPGMRIEPAQRRNEVLALIDAGLRDFSVSRSRARARGWGIGVPDDPDQVIYVWFDALGNYVTSLDYGTGGPAYRHWWEGSDRRVHLLGKGVVRFHAVYWPAILLSAGLPLPTDLLVHDYLMIDGQKISKSSGGGADPVALVDRFGTDAVRWWLLREVPRVGDTDVTVARLVERANADLAGGFGNVVNRVVTMVHRYRYGRVPPPRWTRAPR